MSFFLNTTIRSLCFLGLVLVANSTQASDFSKSIEKKQIKKDAKRWSLSQWMTQKKNNQLMDSWLMFNSPSPYEFFFGIDSSSYKVFETIGNNQTSTTARNYRASFGAFVSAVGLYGEYDLSTEEKAEWKAQLMLRLLGSSDQSTNLLLSYGLANKKLETPSETDIWNHQFAQVKFTLYIMKAFALITSYDVIFPTSSEQNAVDSEGNRTEAGALLEFGALRFYGFWYQEKLEHETTSGLVLRRREGIQFGTRVYF